MMRWASRKVAPPGTVVPDTRRYIRIEKIDIETDMQQAVSGADRVEHPAHDRRHTLFVERAHVEDVDAVLADFPALVRIDGAYANLENLLRIDQWPAGRQDIRDFRFAAEEGDGHAMNVARGRCGRGIEVRMRVQPKHEQWPANPSRIARHAGDAAHGEAVIAAEDQRKPPDEATS